MTTCTQCGGAFIRDFDGPICMCCGRAAVRPEPLPLVHGHSSREPQLGRRKPLKAATPLAEMRAAMAGTR